MNLEHFKQQVLLMYCPFCSMEIDEGQGNCPECGNSLEEYGYQETAETPIQEEIYEPGEQTIAEDDPIEEEKTGENTAEGIEEAMKAVRKKMKKAKYFYKKKKISKKKYVFTIKKCKKQLREYREMMERMEAEPPEVVPEAEDEKVSLPPDVQHRSELDIEDLYSDIRNDESWIDPLIITEFETETRDCANCGEQVRTHWIICPSCREEV